MRAQSLIKPAVFLTSLTPLTLLIYRAINDDLGANPLETITHQTGLWTLYFLLITLTITPARKFLGWNRLGALRRMLGLFGFFYALVHFLTYLVFDHFFDWPEIVKDIVKRPYITVGFSAFVLLIPLAVTSTSGMIRRLGGERWKCLHSLVYVIGTLGIYHFLWLVKADTREPLLYGVLLTLLLATRMKSFPRLTLSRRLTAEPYRREGALPS
jgi:sulfoxide reductase heme-binding subunit YedZ